MADDGALRHMSEPEWLEGDTLGGEHILRLTVRFVAAPLPRARTWAE